MAQNAVSFFDLDRTLIEVNTARLFAFYEYRQKRLSVGKLAKSMAWVTLYHLNLLNIDKAYEHALSHYQGIEEAVLEERTKHFFETQIHHLLLPGAKTAVNKHRALGDQTVVLTNGSPYQARLACIHWGLDDWIANEYLKTNGRLTGKIAPPLCYGEGKVKRAKEYLAPRNIGIQECSFYSDSYSDLPMLEAVGHPYVVNPDPKLRKYAQKRNWPILNWLQESPSPEKPPLPVG